MEQSGIDLTRKAESGRPRMFYTCPVKLERFENIRKRSGRTKPLIYKPAAAARSQFIRIKRSKQSDQSASVKLNPVFEELTIKVHYG